MTAILETALYARDLDAAERFYGDVLGFEKIRRIADRHIFFRLEKSVLLIFNPQETVIPPDADSLPVPPHGARGPGHACFRASLAEQDAFAARLEAAGFPLESQVDWPGGHRSLYFRDPAGNSIEFAEFGLWFEDETP